MLFRSDRSSASILFQESDGEEKKKTASSIAPPVTVAPSQVAAPESDEGETRDSDGGAPAPAAAPAEPASGTKSKKSKKSKKKRKKKAASGHSSVRSFAWLCLCIMLRPIFRVKAIPTTNQPVDRRRRRRRRKTNRPACDELFV